MRRKHAEQKSRRRSLLLVLAVGAISATLMVNSLIGETGYLARRAQKMKIEAITSEVETIRTENQRLSSHIQDLKHDPGTIETLAREQLRLGRSEDAVVTLPETPTPSIP
ncbi:MAG: septum formation initiator family protein [Acidobacteria bacterium]|nr:septum formation initiator family protein [Acidobacteriota bacterium]